MKKNFEISSEEKVKCIKNLKLTKNSRKTIKKELRHNRVNELYLTIIREVLEDEEGKREGISICLFENKKIPEWIEKEYVWRNISRRITTRITSYSSSRSSDST